MDGEDCEEAIREAPIIRGANLTIVVGLNLNVIAPAYVRPGSNLPVVVVCVQRLERCHLC